LNEDAVRDAVTSYIEDRLWEDIGTEDLARRVGMSVSAFIVAFRGCFGTTPAIYIIEQRGKRL
jgi:AraC-like DNA-binding protein